MSFLTDLEIRFVQDDLDVVQEFDVASFAANAKSALSGKIEMLNLRNKVSHYSKALEEAISEISSIHVDKKEIVEFLSKFNTFKILDTNRISVPDMSVQKIGAIKPQYIGQYTNLINSLINDVLNDKAEQEDVDKYLFGDAPERVKRQVVKTAYPETRSVDLVKTQLHDTTVILDEKYIKLTLIPFVVNAGKMRDALVAEATSVLHAIKEAEDNVNAIIKVVNRLKESGDLDIAKTRKVDYIVYNGIRGYMDVLSYVTYITIRKLNEFGSNILAAERIYHDVMNRHDETSMEGVMDTVIPTDTNSLTEDLMQGKVDAFDTLAKNLYNYHNQNPLMGMANGNLKSTGDVLHSAFDMEIDMTTYSSEIYKDIVKMYLEISNGLDILAKNSDEYLLIFDDLRKKAGFILPLEDRFRDVLDRIDDTSNYAVDVPGITDQNLFTNMLAEVKDFPENMAKIGDIILEVKAKMEGVTKRFNDNINGEFKDAEALNELKILMSDLTEQYRVLNNIVGTKCMRRLRTLGEKLASITVQIEKPPTVDDAVPDVDLDHTDYRREDAAFEFADQIALYEEEFKVLQESYIAERARLLRGIVVTEADAPSTGTTGQTDPNAGQDTKPTVQDNSGEGKSSGNTLTKISEMIKNFINTFLTNLQRSSTKNTTWVTNNKQALLNRGYDNVTLNMLPYQELPYTQIIGKVNEVTTIIRGLSPQALQGFSDQQAAYSRVLSPLAGGVNATGNVSPDTQVINFFTTAKTGGAKVVAIANGDLQRLVASEMIPFCESYAGQFNQNLQQALNALGSATDELTQKASQGAQPNQTDNKNTSGNMAQSSKWVGAAVKSLTKGVLNAVKQRNNDYLKGLSALVPKTPVTPPQTTTPQNGQQQAQATANVQTTQQQATQPAVVQPQQ